MRARPPMAPVPRRSVAGRSARAVLVVGPLVVALTVGGTVLAAALRGAPAAGPAAAAGAVALLPALGSPPVGRPPIARDADPTTPPSTDPELNPDCVNSADPLKRADELMANHYRLGSQKAVDLPADPRWTENPLRDNPWQFRFHSMRFVLDLFAATRLTGNLAYRDRAMVLLHDWSTDNPRRSAPSVWAWNDHTTALRAVVLACAADVVPMSTWLRDALVMHGRTLADPAFYRNTGNHALNQAIGLLEVSRVLGRSQWKELAGRRINTLILASVDREGVTNEQSIGYADFNYRRYRQAADRMVAVGLTPSAAFARLNLMPSFLAQATLPNGTYEMIGDTAGWPADAIAGTPAEYAATGGVSGPKPDRTIARYTAGYLFARSGWGEQRPVADESFLSVKWGAAPIFHGHADGMNLTLAAHGSRLLVDPGMFGYNPGPDRAFFKGRPAHNIVTVDGADWAWSTATRLISYRELPQYVDIRLQTGGYAGVVHTRRITYSRALDYILVQDRLTSADLHTYRQLWHLVEDAQPTIDPTTVVTQRPRGNVLIRQLIGSPELRIVQGQAGPVQGWISYKPGQKLAAPVQESILQGRRARYLTLIVPAEGRPSVEVSDLVVTAAGYSVTITIGGRSERVTVSGPSIWVRTLI